MKNNNAVFTQGSVLKHVVRMTATSTTSLLAIFVIDVLSVFYIAMLHDDVLLAALVVGKTLTFFVTSMSMGVAMASGALIASRLGAGELLRARQLAGSGLALVIAVSVSGAAIELLFLDVILDLLGLEARAFAAAQAYLWITLPATLFMAIGQLCMQVLRTSGFGKQPMYIVLTGTAVAAMAEPVFILWLNLGLNGAGYAYLLAASVTASLGVYYVSRVARLTARSGRAQMRADIGQIGRIALPAVFGNLATPVGMAYLMSSVAAYGSQALAGIAVVDRIIQLSFCVFFVLPGALSPIVGQNLGARNAARAREAVKTTYWLALGYGAVVALTLSLSAQALQQLFNVQGEGVRILQVFCQFGGVLWTLIGLQFIAISIFVTMGRPIFVTLFGWLRASLGTVPFVWYGAQLQGSAGALLGHLLGNATIALAACAVGMWVMKVTLKEIAMPVQVQRSSTI